MSKNWAIVVGINNYDNLQSLKYAKRDAEAMQSWFKNEANFDQVFVFTEDSPPIPTNPPISTLPNQARFKRFLNAQFEEPLLKPEDNLWFFFAGHGKRFVDQDYLMFLDSDPTDYTTAISVDFVTQRLRRCGADNVVLLIDACRDEGDRSGLGVGMQEHQGVITFYSCTANQKSWEIDELQQGSFTYSLLEGLRLQGEANCATVERLEQHLRYRVPQLNAHYKKSQQNPSLKAEPPYKMYYILLEQAARIKDVEPLKYQASLAENQGNLLLAKQLWVRVLAVSRGDWEAVEAIGRIAMRQGGSFEPTITTELIIPASGGRSTKEFPLAHNQAEYEQNLTRYQQYFSEVINREYPLKELTKKQLEQLQQSLQLSAEEILQIETPIITEKEAEYQKEQARIRQQQELDRKQQEELHKQQEKEKQRQKEEVEYNQNLQQYEQLFTSATRQEYPLTLAKKNELEHLKYNLSLTNEDVVEIEARITAEIEAYHKKIAQLKIAPLGNNSTATKQPSLSTRFVHIQTPPEPEKLQSSQMFSEETLTSSDPAREAKLPALVSARTKNTYSPSLPENLPKIALFSLKTWTWLRRQHWSILSVIGFSVISGVFAFNGWQNRHIPTLLNTPQTPTEQSIFKKNASKINLQTSPTSVVTNFAEEKLSQGDLSGLTAVEELLDRGALKAVQTALNVVPTKQINDAALNFLKGRLAWQLIQTGDKKYSIDDARRFWKASVEAEPNTILYNNALGFAYYAEGNIRQANDAWFKALNLALNQQDSSFKIDSSTKNSAISQNALISYAGLAVGLYKSALSQPAPKQEQYMKEAIKLSKLVINQDPVNFQVSKLNNNWLWTEKAIADWRSLLEQKTQE